MSDPVMSVTAIFLLCCLAITAQAQSCSKPVGQANMNLKGEAILQDTFPDGSKVSYACEFGYTSAGGSATITCTAGSWSPLRLLCERKSCGDFPDVYNGNVIYPDGGTLFGDRVVFTCNTGYILVGHKVIRCGDQRWMGRPPVCEVVKCTTPGAIGSGSFTPQNENYNYRAVVLYSCDTGFTRNGSKESVCSEDGKFHPEPPNCVWVECEEPVIQNGVFVAGSRPPHKYLSSITYHCQQGYVMIGQATITCTINSQWSPGIPECKVAPKPPTPAKPTTVAPKPPIPAKPTTVAPKPPIPTKPTTDSPKSNGGPTAGIIVGVFLVVLVIGLAIFWCKKRDRRGKTNKRAAKEGEDVSLSQTQQS